MNGHSNIILERWFLNFHIRSQTRVTAPGPQALSISAHAGKILDLRVTRDEMAVVNEIIQGSVGPTYIGHADNIQIYYVEPGTYMLMASVQGCHVAHVFVDETVVVEVSALWVSADERHASYPTDGRSASAR